MSTFMEWFRDQGNRGYLYRMLAALGLIAVAYGLVTESELGLYLALAATVLGTGTAVVNTPTGAQLQARHRSRPDRPGHVYSSGGVVQPGDPGPGRDVRRKFDR